MAWEGKIFASVVCATRIDCLAYSKLRSMLIWLLTAVNTGGSTKVSTVSDDEGPQPDKRLLTEPAVNAVAQLSMLRRERPFRASGTGWAVKSTEALCVMCLTFMQKQFREDS